MKTGLELRLWWGDHLVGEQFFRGGVEASYRVGSSREVDFSMSSKSIGAPCHELVRCIRHGRPTVRLTSKMKGELHRPGAHVMALDEVIDQGIAFEELQGWSMVLGAGDRLTLHLGHVTAELTARAAPKHVTATFTDSVDFTFANTVLAALAAGVFFVITAANHSRDDSSLDDLTTTARTQMLHVLVKAPPPPPIAPIAAVEPKRASEVAKQPHLETPPKPGKPAPGRTGPLSIFQGGGVAALFGRQGIDPDLKRALGGITQVAEAGGGGTSTLRGAGGLNGPGQSIGSVGIEIKGRRLGEGIGLALKGAHQVEPSIKSGPADSVGALDAELIRQVIHSHHDQIRYCYEQVLTQSPDLGGKVSVHFVISADGSVSASNVAQSNTASAQLDACVMGRARTWVFPKPKGGGLVSVTYPFIFKVAGK